MAGTGEQGGIPRKILPIFYILDTSGSMKGAPITALNDAFRTTLPVLKDVADSENGAEARIAVLQYSTEPKWKTGDSLAFLDDFIGKNNEVIWNDLEAGGLTYLGAALTELDKKLSRNAFLDSKIGYKPPVLIFLSDGKPNDDYKSALKVIKQNKWFEVSSKIAFAMGDEANKEALEEVVGSCEAVIKVNDLNTLKMLIKLASVTASQIGSKSRTPKDKTAQEELQEKVKGDDNTNSAPAPKPEPKQEPQPADDPRNPSMGKVDPPWGKTDKWK